jgi:hypothetical protein
MTAGKFRHILEDLPWPTRLSPRQNLLWGALLVGAAYAVLFSLVESAGSAPMADDDEWKRTTLNDINLLCVAAEQFKAVFNVYPPSRILLSNNRQDYARDSQALRDLECLMQIWSGLKWDERLDWSGGVPGFRAAELEGDQCLVFFLAGVNGNGFSTNPANPTEPGGDRRAGPFLYFPENRLIQRLKTNPFRSFQDGYGKNVYAYFSPARNGAFSSDACVSLGVSPYFGKGARAGQFYNARSVQIISAGSDGVFGPGGAWAIDTAALDVTPYGLDDLSNFHGDILGR